MLKGYCDAPSGSWDTGKQSPPGEGWRGLPAWGLRAGLPGGIARGFPAGWSATAGANSAGGSCCSPRSTSSCRCGRSACHGGSVHRRRAEGRGRLAGAGRGGVASGLRTHPVVLRVTLLAALLHEREREITNTLVELLISTAHRIGARAEKKVTEQLINSFKKVSGKENILFKLAEALLGTPERTVRQVVFPAVSGGEATLRELVARVQDPWAGLPADGADHVEGVVLQPLPALADQAARRAGVPLPPAGGRGLAPVQHCERAASASCSARPRHMAAPS